MKFVIVLAMLAVAASASLASDRKQLELPKSLKFAAMLPTILKKHTKGDPITDCTKCYNDVLKAIDQCSELSDDTNEIILCVESIIATAADCVTCICDVLGILGGVDTADCDPAKVLTMRRQKIKV